MKKYKRYIIAVSTVAIMIIAGLMFVSCVRAEVAPGTAIGGKLPNVSVKNKINSRMSALEMYEIGVKNYGDMDYVGGIQSGTINVKAVGVKNEQGMLSKRVKDGDKAYIDNYTWTTDGMVNIKFMDEAVIDANGFRMRSADKIDIVDKKLIAKKWRNTNTFNSLDALLAENPNNPYKVNMFTVNKDTIKEITEPEYDRKLKQYSFSITLKAVESTPDYVAMVNKLLSAQNIKNSTVTFTSLTLDVVMWDNGLFRSITTDESYDLEGKMSIMPISGKSVSNTITNYTYDKTELPFSTACQF